MINRAHISSQNSAEPQPLLMKAKDVCLMLGGIHPRSLARLCERGLIRPVPLLRHKLYSREDVIALIESLKNWEAKA